MLSSRLEPRNRAFGCSHPFRNGVLRQAGTGPSLEHLAGNLVLKGKGVIGFGKPLAGCCLGKEFLVRA